MSDFSENWEQCMHSSGLLVPNVEDANEALEFLHQVHSAWENSGGEAELTIAGLLAAGALVGVDEGALAVLGQLGEIAVAAYLSACISCMASVALEDIKSLFANNELPDFVVAELEGQGVDLTNEAVA
ncbi:hypothetical protein GO988_04610 [Hymenobacter sp. HMF4947]|uniref:Uncharacterized protein n=1 Tax=Hymenobacter ginkgonis TaxID=2682976 RepID=A0A7K1TBQ3_9BACT|nr:hypothetical protein [Hymenobacter ginkgonis]MVN75601.1 hypothetical protein [Hymenobacter ginkgonis]